MDSIVVDASVLAAELLPDEQHNYVDRVFKSSREQQLLLHAPTLLAFETMNVLIFATKRKRISDTTLEELLVRMQKFEVIYDSSIDFTTTIELTKKHGLTVYDAVYLTLAVKKEMPLATLDKSLIRAAKAENCYYHG